VGEEIERRWSQTVVIENKPGASGNAGTQSVARAAPDGHTLLMVSNPFTANISLFKNVPYDPMKSFTPVVEVATGSLALAVHPSVPAHSIKEFIEYVKARPGELNYSSPGVGVPQVRGKDRHEACPISRIGRCNAAGVPVWAGSSWWSC